MQVRWRWGRRFWVTTSDCNSYVLPCVQGDFVEPPRPDTALRSLAESPTRLPCRYQAADGEKVVQVTWYKDLAEGGKDQIITAHFSDGHTEFGRYSGRVRFESSRPTENSALLIPGTEESDEGGYTCHISTFPNGNFERHIALTVWVLPISSLDPVILTEGQSYRVAAACRAVGRPLPRLSWDTDLSGQSQNRTNEGGSVSSYYSLHPLRSMNGRKLDCLVWHPGLDRPRRISNRLVVQYPPDATISTVSGDWFVGLEKAELACDGGGNPKPQNVTWTWGGGALPDGVSTVGGKLVFGRAVRLNDSGVYECVVENNVGVGKTEIALTVTGKVKGDLSDDNLLLIIIGAAAAVLVLVLVLVVLLVNRHHRHKNKRLEMALIFISRQISRCVLQDSGLPSSLIPLKAPQEDGVGPREPDLGLGQSREGESPREEEEGREEEEEEEEDDSSYQISEALSNHFHYSNGVLRPRPHSNAILLHPRGQMI
uniref:Nectin cell adhesion molecule 4b n=1 Tax=Scophthalmus maximus TaxID=52904 RepID=A0A8D3AD79_SCOMX